jgi:Amiloride-sensitive sodium channel
LEGQTYVTIQQLKERQFFEALHQKNVMILLTAVNRAAAMSAGMISFGVAPPEVATFLTMSSLKAVGTATYNTLTYQRSVVDQTDRSSFLKQYECVDNTDEDVNKKLAPGYPAYTKENCELALKQAKAVELLNCSLIFYPPIPGYRYCSPKETTVFFTSLR